SLEIGKHHVYAVYKGDQVYQPDTSDPLTQTVDPARTSLSLAQSPDPAILGRPVTFTAAVSVLAPGAGVATGEVVFREGKMLLGSAELNGDPNNDMATLTVNAPVAGMPVVTATYEGNDNFASSSASIQDPTLISTTTTLSSSANPSSFGTSATITATV